MRWLLSLAILITMTGCVDYSEGFRTGVITKFSTKGIFCKTDEGTLSLGYTKNGTGTVSSGDWEFTIEDDSVIPDIERATREGYPVKLYYEQELMVSPCRADTVYFVYRVEKLD